MSILLDHLIVPARDKIGSAQFFATIFGLEFDRSTVGHFAAVRVNDSLTLDFASAEDFQSHHYAFKVSEARFDAIFARMQEDGMPYGSGPGRLEDGKFNHRRGGRGVYFRDPDGHVLELLTA
ncbi:MAG TPA: VOC family protein [Gammaproteobacteria bacterium]|nr:VOC family protein [Gammaproteobacteria bacterium]